MIQSCPSLALLRRNIPRVYSSRTNVARNLVKGCGYKNLPSIPYQYFPRRFQPLCNSSHLPYQSTTFPRYSLSRSLCIPERNTVLRHIGNTRRNYIVLPSSISELGRNLIQSLKFYVGQETKESSRRRLVLTMRKADARFRAKKSQARSKYQSKKLQGAQFLGRVNERFLAGKERTKTKFKLNRIHLQGTKTIMLTRARKMVNRAGRNAVSKEFRASLIPQKWRRQEIELKDVGSSSRFDEYGYPLASRDSVTGRFINPWCEKSCQHQPMSELAKWRLGRLHKSDIIPRSAFHFIYRTQHFFKREREEENVQTIPESDKPSDSSTAGIDIGATDKVKFTWIGHSTCLVQMHGFTILTDPVFANRIGPLAPLAGVKRFIPPAHTIEDIGTTLCNGTIDAVLISHDHYDHLDYSSIYELVQSNSINVRKWCVPLGMKKWILENFGSVDSDSAPSIEESDIVEMEWWDNAHFSMEDNSTPGATRNMEITCAPAQHWCSRTPFDRNARLWCSWAVRTTISTQDGETSDENSNHQVHAMRPSNDQASTLAFYFAGDTGFPANSFPLHRQISDRLGPFDLSALPIGAYKPKFYMHDSHMCPKESSIIHKELRSRKSVAIHWGTFPLADEAFYEPPELLQQALDTQADENSDESVIDKSDDSFVVIGHGGTVFSDPSTTFSEMENDATPFHIDNDDVVLEDQKNFG